MKRSETPNHCTETEKTLIKIVKEAMSRNQKVEVKHELISEKNQGWFFSFFFGNELFEEILHQEMILGGLDSFPLNQLIMKFMHDPEQLNPVEKRVENMLNHPEFLCDFERFSKLGAFQ